MEPARMLGERPAVPAPPRLATVHRLPRRVSPAVIRRRRAAALLGLVLLAVLAVAALRVGSGRDDAAAIAALLSRTAAHPAALCDHMSARMLADAGGRAVCLRSSPARAPSAHVGRVRVDGATATATVAAAGATQRFYLVREDGGWKIDDVR